jgi:hypothetical protein
MPAEEPELRLSPSWVQGAFLRRDLLRSLLGPRSDGLVGVVVSHDCDLANRSRKKEPTFEWIAARIVGRPDGNFANGRNSRQLHFGSAGPDGEHLSLSMNDRRFDDRSHLVGVEPSGVLEEGSRRTLAEWMANRYHRSGFPDAFNDRRAKKARAIRDILNGPGSGDLEGLWVALAPDAESEGAASYGRIGVDLREGDPYKIVLWVTVKDGIASQALDAVEELVEKVAEALRQCEGLELPEEPQIVRESDFSLAHLRRFLRLDDWDDLSRG